MRYKIYQQDCLSLMKSIPDNYVDAVVTDPPYGLKFMGKRWDYDVPSVEIWEECYRILKPGGHLLSFAGTRTYHRLVTKIEDAGFEIRDMIAWIYGQGFPKSHNISKALDKMAGAERETIGIKPGHEEFAGRKTRGHLDFKDGTEGFDRPWMHDDEKRERYHMQTAPATEEAKQWDGWGTALKPAIEPICLARKPLEGTVAENILKYGTGGINIDGCKVPLNGEVVPINKLEEWSGFGEKVRPDYTPTVNNEGRFPANVIHDGSKEVIAEFPQSKGGSSNGNALVGEQSDNIPLRRGTLIPRNDDGSAARFFYCAKASKKDRDEGLEDLEAKRVSYMNTHNGNPDEGEEWQPIDDRTGKKRNRFAATMRNNHPTVKPTNLMRYLCKLITPPNGKIIDPFMGSGSTGKAALLEGFRFIGIELDEGYFKIAKRRIEFVANGI